MSFVGSKLRPAFWKSSAQNFCRSPTTNEKKSMSSESALGALSFVVALPAGRGSKRTRCAYPDLTEDDTAALRGEASAAAGTERRGGGKLSDRGRRARAGCC